MTLNFDGYVGKRNILYIVSYMNKYDKYYCLKSLCPCVLFTFFCLLFLFYLMNCLIMQRWAGLLEFARLLLVNKQERV